MKRVKRHKIKKEKAESSFQQEEHDLAYYIHDRVELMHQVFSMLKYKELMAMAPECVRNLAIGDLQELCTEELLGISSKRLLATLDGAEPPSDTESSSPSPPPDQLETISLDSISSDEELLDSTSKKKKHKHRHHGSKSKSKKKDKSKEPETQLEENSELSKASRAGLTVLELLELQARARAIRAQLQQEQANRLPSETAIESSHHTSDNEVEIKEEPPDVVEISSEDEKPDVNQLRRNIADKTTSSKVTNTETVKEPEKQHDSQSVTKRINDLIITVPHAKPTRKIKLNRNKVTVFVPNNSGPAPNETRSVAIVTKDIAKEVDENPKTKPEKSNESKTKKKKKDKRKKTIEKEGSDHDEITLQLSDSEKMDLLEDLGESRKNYGKMSSSSEDTESSSSDSDNENTLNKTPNPPVQIQQSSLKTVKEKDTNTFKDEIAVGVSPSLLKNESSSGQIVMVKDNLQKNNSKTIKTYNNKCEEVNTVSEQQYYNSNPSQNTNNNVNKANENNSANEIKDHTENNNNNQNSENLRAVTDISETSSVTVIDKPLDEELNISNKDASQSKFLLNDENVMEFSSIQNADKESQKDNKGLTKKSKKDLSDGELSDRRSSEVEALDVQPEIVCISDEDGSKNKVIKKKKKKEKKSKKSKKSKLDFREGADQNFYRDANIIENNKYKESVIKSPSYEPTVCNEKPIDLDSDDVYEILELSDDSSCYEVEGTVLSKEPTAAEIEALSAKIDEIECEDVVIDKQIREHERVIAEKRIEEQNDVNIDNMSWKDRYLDSNKVKKVLTTANILNALRKKNKELKKKIEDSKNIDNKDISNEEIVPQEINNQLEEGSIEQYNALQGTSKYVDPVKEAIEENKDIEQCENLVTKASDENNVTKEMKKDAKQLLKMYKKLLKHNDMNKQKDPIKKKKKKLKKKDKQDSEKAANNTTYMLQHNYDQGHQSIQIDNI